MGMVLAGVKVPALMRLGVRLSFQIRALLACTFTASTAFANQVDGEWISPVLDNWPLIPLHAALTPDGRVLTFGSNSVGAQTGFFAYDIWDPIEGLSDGHVTLQNLTLTDIFCSFQIVLPNSGQILMVGGDNWDGTKATSVGNNRSTIFDYRDDTLSRGNDMARQRWYGSATLLMNGEVYVQGGSGGGNYVAEMRNRNGVFRRLDNVKTGNGGYDYYYPRNFLAPDGRVFGFDVNGKMYYVTTEGTGTITLVGQLDISLVGKWSTAAMFRPGKILLVSGNSNKAVVIDINGVTPVVTPTDNLSTRRAWSNATILPDGRVLVTGGSGSPDKLIDVNNAAEIWNPDTGHWTVGASGARPRLYHSMALLLPDASVLVGGGGASITSPQNNFHSEIYYPPYLYKASGGLASRPIITSAPGELAPGLDFSMQVGTSDSISRVTLLHAGAVTHSVNLAQRFVELSFTADGGMLFVAMHDRATDVPPGYYLLFVINDSGVPSEGSVVRIDLPGSGGGQDTTAPTKPRNLAISMVNGNPKLVWDASSDANGVAGYSIHRSEDGSYGVEAALTPQLTWTDSTVVEGTHYTYGVVAYDAAGNLSEYSSLKSVTAYALPKKPGSFSVNLSNGHPRLSFTASTDNVGVVGYNVYRSTNGSLGSLYAQIAGAPWIDTSAQAGITYTYAVRARDAAGYLSSATTLKSIKAN
jgi:hypothetical protein